MMITALAAERLFTGEAMLTGQAVLIRDGLIAGIVSRERIPADAVFRDLGPGLIAPGLIDAQVNGGGGVLFNETPDVDALARMALAHARHGTTAMMPTYITDTPEGMAAAIGAVRAALEAHVPGIAGIHLEGPFLSLARKGAHDPALIRPMDGADVARVTSAGFSPVILTVAPETVPAETIRLLTDAGIIVSIGHTDASYDVAMAAAAAGARGVTHLFNAMSQLQGRNPGVVGAALNHDGLWCGLIADGLHVHPASLRLALKAKTGSRKMILVTDAMPPAGDANDIFFLNGRKVTRENGKLTLEDGTLAGSNLTMDQAVAYAVSQLGIDLTEALRMASLYPAEFLRLEGSRGRIRDGFRADLVHLGPDLMARGTWIGGQEIV